MFAAAYGDPTGQASRSVEAPGPYEPAGPVAGCQPFDTDHAGRCRGVDELIAGNRNAHVGSAWGDGAEEHEIAGGNRPAADAAAQGELARDRPRHDGPVPGEHVGHQPAAVEARRIPAAIAVRHPLEAHGRAHERRPVHGSACGWCGGSAGAGKWRWDGTCGGAGGTREHADEGDDARERQGEGLRGPRAGAPPPRHHVRQPGGRPCS